MIRSLPLLAIAALPLLADAPPRPGKAVALAAVDYDGLGKAIRGLRGKVVVVDIWATWCPPCKREFPELVKLHDKYAADGRDPLFHRGETAADRYLGDPRQPHPCLAPLAEGPFHAIPIRPGTLGTCGGLVTDSSGRVLDRRGEPVGGLFAAGNVAETVFADAYPGGGATLGSAITRAYAVGRTLADTL